MDIMSVRDGVEEEAAVSEADRPLVRCGVVHGARQAVGVELEHCQLTVSQVAGWVIEVEVLLFGDL